MNSPARWATAVVLVLAVVVAALVSRTGNDDAIITGRVLVADAAFPVALVALPGGGLRYGERLTGDVREVDTTGRLFPEPVASVAVSTGGQRGLLGLAVDPAGRTFAAWTAAPPRTNLDPNRSPGRPDSRPVRPDERRLVVGQVAPGLERLVWLGPPSTDLANGGHLVVAPDGRLVVGIGDLQDPPSVKDPTTPNGKLLALDPDGPPDQRPAVLSSGWNNPFAFTYTPGGQLWVADNAPGRRPERLARGDTGGGPPGAVTELDGRSAPSSVAALDDGRLAVCGFVSRRLDLYRVGGTAARRSRQPLAGDCATSVALLADGHLAYADESTIRVLD